MTPHTDDVSDDSAFSSFMYQYYYQNSAMAQSIFHPLSSLIIPAAGPI